MSVDVLPSYEARLFKQIFEYTQKKRFDGYCRGVGKYPTVKMLDPDRLLLIGKLDKQVSE